MDKRIEERRTAHDGVMRKAFAVSKADVVDDDKHIIRVKFASFGNVDSAGDLLVRGCFAKSIIERGPASATNRKIAFLWQHDFADPIGKVLKIEELEDGAYAEVQLSNFDAVPNAKRAWHQLIDGDINQFSFGFNYIWDKMEYDENLDAYIVKEVKLHEISVVTLGCNEQTAFVGTIKSLEEALSRATPEEKQKIKSQILDILKEAEPTPSLTPRTSIFAKIGKTL